MSSGERPTVVTYNIYTCELCKVGSVESALDFIQMLRRKSQPLNAYSYNPILYEFCLEGKIEEVLIEGFD